MALFAPLPQLSIPKTRTTVLGGQSAARQTFTVDMQRQGLADLRHMLRTTAANDTAEQLRLNNPPSAVVVDNKPAKAFADAQRRIVVLFGTRLAAAAMRMVEQTLRAAIVRATFPRTGRLMNIGGAWRWKLITPGRGVRIVTAATDLGTFVRGSMLVLEPYSVPHATRVNSLVMGAGKSSRGTQRRAVGGAAFLERRARKGKEKQPVGFLRATVEALRARAEFRQFAITVAFSKQHAVPGELSRVQGSGSIVIQLKRR